MTDMDLLDFMVRQYQTQGKMAQSLKLSEGAISKWRSRGELPKAWKMYFMAQFEKKGETEIVGNDQIRAYFDNPLSNFANAYAYALNDYGQKNMRSTMSVESINLHFAKRGAQNGN